MRRLGRAALLLGGAALLLYAGLLATLYQFQTRAIYPGWWRGTAAVAFDKGAYRVVATRAEAGQPGRLLYAPARPGMPVILFFHGNGDSVAGSAVAVEPYRRLGYGAVLPEYPGYGGLAGTPDEQGLYRAARAARGWMRAQGIAPDRTIVMGYSLGSGVATESALEEAPRALVLVAGFASIADAAAMRFPWIPARWLVTERFDSVAKIARLHCPVLLVHGREDATVPVANSRLLAAARPDAQVIVLPGLGHEIVWRPAAQALIARWLGALRVGSGQAARQPVERAERQAGQHQRVPPAPPHDDQRRGQA